jgi:hypothetical protein
MKRIKLFFLMMAFAGMANATVYYVSSAGNNTTGDSWTNAFTSPAAAIASATPVSGSEFWVKQGTYTSAATLSWETGQSFYGGFVGTETLRSQRSTDATLTILEGNNTNKVLNAPSMASPTTWDGFTIQKGLSSGGGGGAFLQKNAILSNCIVQNNKATDFGGGGIFIQGDNVDSIKVINCTVKNNTITKTGAAKRGGGGIYIKAGSFKSVIRGCTIESNTADGLAGTSDIAGGGVYLCDGTIENSTVKNNIITNRAAANPFTLSTSGKCQGGGIFIMPQAVTTNPIAVKNCTVSGNYSEGSVGGGISIDPLIAVGTAITAPVNITKTIISNNWAYKNGGGIMTEGLEPTSTSNYVFANCVIANNESSTVTGGGVFINNVAAYAGTVSFANCTVANNKMVVATYGGAGIYYNNIKADITNCAFWGNGGVTTFYNVKVKNTLTTNKLINCAFDSRFVDLEVSPVATPADLTGKVIVELSNTGSTVGKYYANFTSPTNFTGKAVTADNITNLAAADWSITAGSACVNAGATLGAVTTDFIGTARPQGSAYDIGAYEAKPLQTLDATTAISSIKATTATSGGNVTSEGGATVTRGVCWSAATSTPTIENAKTTNGTGLGAFTSNLSGLTPNSRYYVRAYATNLTGTIYGAAVNFYTDPLVTYTSGWPKIENSTSSGFTAKANINVAGMSYYVVLPSGATAPTSAQVKAGQNAAGSAVTSGTITCTNPTTEYTASITSLAIGTAYDLYFVAENAAGNNLQASPTLVSATTLQTYSISASAGTSGSITSGASTYDSGSTATLVATADAGYRFVNWTLNTSAGAEQSTLASYPFTVSEAKTLVANFASVVVAVPTGNSTNASTLKNCATCDVSVSGANTVLTINEIKTVNSITATAGGKLDVAEPLTVTGAMVIEAGAKLDLSNTLSVTGDLTFKADETGSFSAKIGTGVTLNAASKVKFVKTMLDTKWYFISFPCIVNINEITQLEGGAFVLGNDWYIKYYDGQSRADNRGGANWVEIKDQITGTLTANKGYIIGLKSGIGTKHLSFVLDHSVVTSAEIAARPVAVKIWDATAGTHAGWNLVGQPFLSRFTGNQVTGASMVTIPDAITGKTYTQPAMSAASFDPFSAYFIQAGADESLSFEIAGRSLAPAIVATDLSDRVQLNFTSATGVDYTNLIMDNDQIAGYQIGKDLEKWVGTGTDKPQIYTQLSGINYAFNALPMTDVQNLPVGIYTKTAGTTTISANAAKAPSLTKLLLLDKSNGTTTDLLSSNYSFIANAGTNNTRFVITAQRVPTENRINELNGDATISIADGRLVLINIVPSTVLRIYDTIGRLIVNKTMNSTDFKIKLNLKGIYTVQLQNGTKTSTRKVIF